MIARHNKLSHIFARRCNALQSVILLIRVLTIYPHIAYSNCILQIPTRKIWGHFSRDSHQFTVLYLALIDDRTTNSFCKISFIIYIKSLIYWVCWNTNGVIKNVPSKNDYAIENRAVDVDYSEYLSLLIASINMNTYIVTHK